MIPLVIINEVTKHGFFPPLSSINLIKTTGIGESEIGKYRGNCIFKQLFFFNPSFIRSFMFLL